MTQHLLMPETSWKLITKLLSITYIDPTDLFDMVPSIF